MGLQPSWRWFHAGHNLQVLRSNKVHLIRRKEFLVQHRDLGGDTPVNTTFLSTRAKFYSTRTNLPHLHWQCMGRIYDKSRPIDIQLVDLRIWRNNWVPCSSIRNDMDPVILSRPACSHELPSVSCLQKHISVEHFWLNGCMVLLTLSFQRSGNFFGSGAVQVVEELSSKNKHPKKRKTNFLIAICSCLTLGVRNNGT